MPTTIAPTNAPLPPEPQLPSSVVQKNSNNVVPLVLIEGVYQELFTPGPPKADGTATVILDLAQCLASATFRAAVQSIAGTAATPPPATTAAPTATSLAVRGTEQVGSVLSAYYIYNGGTEGASVTQWYRADDTTGLNRVQLPNGPSYMPVAADQNKRINFVVTVVSSTGATGTPTASLYTAPIAAANTVQTGSPTTLANLIATQNVTLTGDVYTGTDGVNIWLAVGEKLLANTDGWVQWITGSGKPGAMNMLNPGTALPNGSSTYGNVHGQKNNYSGTANVVTEGTELDYPSIMLNAGDPQRLWAVGPNIFHQVSKDNAASFATFATSARHTVNGVQVDLYHMMAGEATTSLRSVTTFGLI